MGRGYQSKGKGAKDKIGKGSGRGWILGGR